MYVEPSHRGTGAGSALLDGLIAAAGEAGYARLRLDSPDFMTDAHRLYLRRGFEPIEPYAESEIPEDLRAWWVFVERPLLGGDESHRSES
jgi:GNAT superfamily N-acetyltransferase